MINGIAYVQVEDNQHLNELCRQWQSKSVLALDTEFIRTNTFYPRTGLLQLCDGDRTYLIDPLPMTDWAAFKALLESPDIIKVFHSCSEDMLVFWVLLGLLPTPVFDTQIALALLNQGFGVSYQNLVKLKTGLDIPKGETRSDWLQRPLSPEQLDYAALDVAFLPEIYQGLQADLEDQGKSGWMREECERLLRTYEREVNGDFSADYLNFKAGWQLNRRQLAALQRLVAWREVKARKRDKPKNWIINDQALLTLAQSLPADLRQLGQVPELSPKMLQYEGEALLKIFREVDTLPEAMLPTAMAKPLTQAQKKMLKDAQNLARAKAEEVGVAAELLTRKKTLMSLLEKTQEAVRRHGPDVSDDQIWIPEELQGWREHLLLSALLEIFKR